MGDIIIGIHQPNFFPWFGYFLKIAKVNKFIFLDDAQTQKKGGSYLNRTKININGEAKWLTAPIKRKNGLQIINSTHYLNSSWRKNIINTLQMNYGKTPFYDENKKFICNLINYESNLISDYNVYIIKELCKILHISTPLYLSSLYAINKTSTDRLISIIKSVNGNIYLSGMGGKKYQNIELFKENNIKIIYNSFAHPKYSQAKANSFLSGLSILDIIFNIGRKNLKKIISNS